MDMVTTQPPQINPMHASTTMVLQHSIDWAVLIAMETVTAIQIHRGQLQMEQMPSYQTLNNGQMQMRMVMEIIISMMKRSLLSCTSISGEMPSRQILINGMIPMVMDGETISQIHLG